MTTVYSKLNLTSDLTSEGDSQTSMINNADVDLIDKINPIQAGGGTMCPPYRFFSCCAETACSSLMKLPDF